MLIETRVMPATVACGVRIKATAPVGPRWGMRTSTIVPWDNAHDAQSNALLAARVLASKINAADWTPRGCAIVWVQLVGASMADDGWTFNGIRESGGAALALV